MHVHALEYRMMIIQCGYIYMYIETWHCAIIFALVVLNNYTKMALFFSNIRPSKMEQSSLAT